MRLLKQAKDNNNDAILFNGPESQMAVALNDSAIGPAGMSGNQYQQAMRGITGYKAEKPLPGFEEDYRNALSGVQDTLKDLMMRKGGEGVVAGLKKADAGYRNMKVLDKAVTAARNGSQSGEINVFTPAQLNTASSANAAKYGGTGATENRPFYKLATLGQKVLPSKTPDTGNLLRFSLGGGLLGGVTGGAGLASGGDPMTTVGAPIATTGLLALLGTKTGQKQLVKAIMDRGPKAQKLGGWIGGRKAKGAISGAGAGTVLSLNGQ